MVTQVSKTWSKVLPGKAMDDVNDESQIALPAHFAYALIMIYLTLNLHW
jgi:hypothetical protein